MGEAFMKTDERISPQHIQSLQEYVVFLRHVFAYEYAQTVLPQEACVLDIGCGEGYGTSHSASHCREIIGIDVDTGTIARANEAYGTPTCRFQTYDGIRLPFPDASFDGILSFQVIEHITDDEAFLFEMRRVMKQGAVCILTTPNRTYRLRPDQKPWNPFHVREYDAQGFSAVLSRVFPDAHVLGIRGTAEVQEIEKERVREGSSLIPGNCFGLKRCIPDSVKSALKRFLKKRPLSKIVARQNNPNYWKRYSTADFYIITDTLSESLDLCGICRV